MREESTRHFGDQYRLTAVTKKLNMPILQKMRLRSAAGLNFGESLRKDTVGLKLVHRPTPPSAAAAADANF